MRPRPVIAIDGPAGSGKSTVARRLSAELGFRYVDTGALYRAVAWLADEAGVSWDDGPALAALLRGRDLAFDADGALSVDGAPAGTAIRSPRISGGASAVARHREVRDALLAVQRRLGREGGVVLEGRDIGSVVFPDAEVKFFLTASVRERARRRHAELASRGVEASLAQVEREQEARDRADRGRAISPLVRAADAETVDCDGLGVDEVVQRMKSSVRDRFPLT